MANKESNYGGSFSETGKIGGEYKGEDASAVQDSAGLGQVHETSPEMLQNTPSNIARLEDVIEHNKGRQKYLKQTRSPSDGEDIRWYFCKVPLAVNELAASVPRTEIIGKSEYFRFSVRDSLALEASFLEREDELLSGWWKEYAECSEGPNGLPRSSTVTADAQPNLSDTEVSQSTELYEEERVGVPVKGGLYEVDLAKRHSFPVYWHGENRRVLRGHWFARKNGLDWLPLREDVAEQLELAYRCQVWHRRTFQPSGLFAARVDLQGTTQGLHALFTGEDDTWEAWLGVDASGFSIGLRGNGIKLRRGFSVFDSLKSTQDELRQQKEEEMDDYCAQVPVRHLVFMVHGIGQRLEKANLVDDVGDFRKITAGLAEQHLTSYQRNHQRVLFIPCQWRRGLKLSGESAVEKITLEGVRGLRVMLSATVHDVLYYMSPIYCQDIIDSVSNQLNRLYMKFIKRNPGYDGKVSIYGHSLGSVLSYDILCHQESLRSPFPIDGMYTGKVRNEESHVVATDQSAPECSIASLEEQTAKRDDQTSMLVSALESTISSSQLDAAVHEERAEDIFLTVDPSSTSQEEEISIKAYATTGPMEQSYASLREAENFTKSNDTASSECVQELNHDCGDTYSLNRKSLDAEPCINSQIHDADTVTIAENKYEDTRDKDKVITSLKEEVNSLKAKLAELESSYKDGKTNSQESFQGDKIENVTPRPSSSEELSTGKDDSRKSYTPYIKYTKLKFKVDTFFAVGSPLGVFLALRNIRIGIGKGQEYWQDEQIREGMPLCRRMFNIFHPFDPVAYRVEPLVCKEYISKRPVMIPYHKGGKRLHIGFQEFTEDLAARSQAIVKHLNSMRVKMVNMLQPRNKDKVEAIEDVKEGEERTYGSIMMQRLTGSEDGRIDHVLQDKTFEHAYISAIGAHTNYWRDHDTALFIFKHLYRDIPEDAETSEARSKQSKPAGLIYQTDTLDEDLPLTFSDTALVREFQWKAKKTMGIS